MTTKKTKGSRKTKKGVLTVPVTDEAVDWNPEEYHGKRPNSSDPIGKVSIFEESGRGIPAFSDASPSRIFEYVDSKAKAIGAHIPKNRGVPASVEDTANMLSQEEKAIVIHGRAIGIPYRLVFERLNQLRAEANLPLITSDPIKVCNVAVSRHRDIVAAIQSDMLAAVEEWSPLVSGQQRFIWRARLIQMYADVIKRLSLEPYDAIRSIDSHGNVEWLNKVDEIRRLDKAMAPHMTYFDKLGVRDMNSIFTNPSEKIQEAQARKAEETIEQDFADGTISEVERLKRIRALRHGDSE